MEIPHGLTPRQLAERAAVLIMRGDHNRNAGRDFDNCWESGDEREVARAFMRLYWNSGTLRAACARYMTPAWVVFMEGAYPRSQQEQLSLYVLQEDV